MHKLKTIDRTVQKREEEKKEEVVSTRLAWEISREITIFLNGNQTPNNFILEYKRELYNNKHYCTHSN